MAYIPGFQLHCEHSSLSPHDQKEIENEVYERMDEITRLAPSDSAVSIDVLKGPDHYRIRFRLASGVLQFEHITTGISAYVAIDKALMLARRTLAEWSVRRPI